MNFSGSVGQNFFASSAPSPQPPIYPRCWMGVGENFLSTKSDCMNFSGSVGQIFFVSSAPSPQPPTYPRCWMGVGENFLSTPIHQRGQLGFG